MHLPHLRAVAPEREMKILYALIFAAAFAYGFYSGLFGLPFEQEIQMATWYEYA